MSLPGAKMIHFLSNTVFPSPTSSPFPTFFPRLYPTRLFHHLSALASPFSIPAHPHTSLSTLRLPPLVQIRSRLTGSGVDVPPLVVFAKDAHFALELLSDSGYDMMGLDWTIPPAEGRRRTNITVQGEQKENMK